MKPVAAQRGFSVLALLGALVLVAAVLLGFRAVPAFLEALAVRSAVARAAQQPSESEARAWFDQQARMDGIVSLDGRSLGVRSRSDGRLVVRYDYQREIPLWGPATLIWRFQGGAP